MEQLILTFDEKEAYDLAYQYFIKTCGFHLDRPKHQKMMEEGLAVRDEGIAGINIRAKINIYSKDVYVNSKIQVGEDLLECHAFEQIDSENVEQIYVYVLTAGELIYSDDDPIMKQLYSDIWGTAYTDAGRDLLEATLKNKLASQGLFLSDSFGPGFYGMENTKTREIFSIVDTDELGVEVRESGIMVPLKSVAGVYFAVKNKEGLPLSACADCIGTHSGCSFCHVLSR